MRAKFFITGLTYFLLLALASSTLLTFYIDEQIQQPLDFVEINAVVKAGGDSLEESIDSAAETIKNIEELVDNYCKTYTEKALQKDQCSQMIEISPYSIKPQYEIAKNKEQFAGFIVAHQINLRVKETDGFGQFVDDIMKVGINKINSLEWKPKEQLDGEQIAMENGLQQAQDICKKIGSKLSKIVSVQEVTDFGEEPQEEEDDKDQEQEQEEDEQPPNVKDEIVYYKFVVECQRGKQK